jgi:hypothetical protein
MPRTICNELIVFWRKEDGRAPKRNVGLVSVLQSPHARRLTPSQLNHPLHAHGAHISFEFGEQDRRQGGMRLQADMR